MYAKNRARLSIQRASQMLFLLESYVFTFSEAEMLDLSSEDDDYMHRDVSLCTLTCTYESLDSL